jgi:GT2 family glycosyltransferase
MPETPSFQLSVVIVTYNNRDLIIPCLDGLRQATNHLRTELFLIDNASQDGTIALLRQHENRLKSEYQSVHMIYNADNLGYSKAVNQGLIKSSGEHILMLNPDVIIQPETVRILIRQLTTHEKIAAIAPQLRFMDGGIQPSCRRFPRKLNIVAEITGFQKLFHHLLPLNDWHMRDFDHRSTRTVDQPQGAFLLTKKAILRSVGLLDERFFMFFSDVDWCRRVNQHNGSILFCAETWAMHAKGASIYQNRAQMVVSSHRSFIQYFCKYDRTPLHKSATFFVMLLLLTILIPRLLVTQLDSKKG